MCTPLVRSLFSSCVTTHEVRAGDELSPLFEEEQRHVARAVEKRRLEFQRGRHCARRALLMLGKAPCAIATADDRAPVWPQGFVGSITHTGKLEDGFAAAAVASTKDLQSLGLDAESATPLDQNLFPRVLTEREQTRLLGVEADAAGLLAKLYFSAKEAFYKCQYPLTQEFLGFQDVELEVDVDAGSFTARLLKVAGHLPPDTCFQGRFLITDELVLTAVEQPRR